MVLVGHLSEVDGSWIVFSFFDFCASFGLMGMKHLAPPSSNILSLSLYIDIYIRYIYIFVIYIYIHTSLSLSRAIDKRLLISVVAHWPTRLHSFPPKSSQVEKKTGPQAEAIP